MKLNGKILSGLLATSAIAFGISAYAQPGMMQGCDHGPGMGMQGKGMGMMGDPSARAEQHLSQFKSQLKITPQQEPLWQAFAEKMKSNAGQGMKNMRETMQQPMTAPERMDKMTAAMKERLASMESTHEAFKRLYDALTPEQKAAADKHVSMMGMGSKGGKGPGKMQPPQGRS